MSQHLLAAVVAEAGSRKLLSEEHFSVDGTLIQASEFIEGLRTRRIAPHVSE